MGDRAVDCEFGDYPGTVGGDLVVGDSDQQGDSGLLDGSAIGDVTCRGGDLGEEELAKVRSGGRRSGRELK